MLPLPGLLILRRGERTIDADQQEQVLDILKSRGTTLLVSLLDQTECDADDSEHLRRAAERRGIRLVRAPIPDFSAPDETLDWPRLAQAILGELSFGRGVAFCCLAGYGRSGMMAARVLIETGLPPRDAIAAVRAVRPGAIESEAQVSYLLSSSP
ncbi:phosphatase [Bosea sp. BIWAKO-01]|uniref:protein-tyrosine phosphatase family protein n=1 Tax=Bosea sp. BIWAKO-01 TaxID=506668 RepID=UPI000868B26F|nr:phosphatase [Bosea sp. BIWAKO-01]GAU82748.1 protein-tyrosine phosphatase-related protein [Bosea sp. BIWAKO-01]